MLGHEIKKYLENNGIKQSFVAKKTSIHRSRLNDVLNEKSELKAKELASICDVLKVPMETFRQKST